VDKSQATSWSDQFFEKLRLGRVNDIRRLLADEVEFHVIGRPGVVPFAGTYRGKEEVLRYLSSFMDANELVDVIVQFHLDDARDSARIASHVNIISDVRSSGKRYDMEFLYKWEFADSLDKVKNMTLYYSTWHMAEAFSMGGDGSIIDQRGTSDFHTVNVDFDTAVLAENLYNTFYVRGDVAETFQLMGEDIVLIEKGNPALPSNGVYYGKMGARQLITGVFSYQIYKSPPVFSNYIRRDNKTDVTLDVHFGDAVTGKDFHITLNQSLVFDTSGLLLELKSYHDSQEIWMNHRPE
jgi:ketosteroid isomerase-like protein